MLVRLLFIAQLLVGGFLLLRGIVHPVIPSFRLDRILTPQELQDVELRTTTLDILHRVQKQNDDRSVWIVAGVIVTLTSIAGAIAAGRSPSEPSTIPAP